MQTDPRTHPLVLPAAALLTGIWLGDLVRPGAFWPLVGAALAGAAALWRAGRQGRFPTLILVLCFLLLGAGLFCAARDQPPPADHVFHRADGPRLEVTAQVTSAVEPSAGGRGRWFLAQALTANGRPAIGLMRLSLDHSLDPPPVGSRIRFRTALRSFVNFANPGGFDYVSYMAEQGLLVRAWLGRSSGLTVTSRAGPGAWFPPGQAARQKVGRVLDRLAPSEGRALLRALVLGQRGGLSAPLREAFSALGAAHLLAISGLHLGLVLGLAFLLLRLLPAAAPWLARRLPYTQVALVAALVPASAYAALAGWSTPTIRALIMAACLAGAVLAGRPYRPEGGLALAALIIGIIWPRAVLGVSFQLSFVAVAAILLAMGFWPRGGVSEQGGGRWWRAPLGWLMVSAVVGLAVWPLAAHHFHNLPLYSIPANALLVPLVGLVVLPLGLLAAGAGLVWAGAGQALFSLAVWPAQAAADLAGWMSRLPGAVTYVAGPDVLTVACIYAAAGALILMRGRLRWAAGLTALAAALVSAFWPAPGTDGRLTAWVLDVGQGSSAALRTPAGAVLLVDGGGMPGGYFDVGARVVAPVLWHLGWGRPEVVACSHRQLDHAGGLGFVLRHLGAGQVWVNGPPNKLPAFQRVWDAARRGNIPIRLPADLPPEMELAGARLRVLWPPANWPAVEENDLSLWLGVGLGRTWLWLPGDAGLEVERRVTPQLPVDGEHIVIAPHHGSRGGLTPGLLARLKPSWVIVSAGCHNRHGLPCADTVARARAAGARVISTARRGAVNLVSDGTRWRVTPWLSRPRRCSTPSSSR